MRVVLAALVVACAPAPEPSEVVGHKPSAPLPALGDQVRRYTIWLGGARVGTAVEHEAWTARGVHLQRDEQLRFTRGDAAVSLATTIDIDADAELVPSHVTWRARQGDDARLGEATRSLEGWQVLITGGGAILDGEAVPVELLPLLVRRDGHFAGRVFLPARGFVLGTARIEPVAPGRLVARIALDGDAQLEATIDLGDDGAPARVVDGDGVIASRASEADVAAAFPTVDLIAATSLPIAGTRRAASPRIVLAGELALPPLPGQLAVPGAHGIALELDARLPGDLPDGERAQDRRAEITALVADVRARITPDLSAPRGDPLAVSAGDCTTFALAYAALAARRGIATRIVTGLRVDHDRLVRHRWAVSWTGQRWVAVDAAFGAVPAGGDLIGLAMHGADDAGLIAGEAALTHVHSASWD